MVETIKAEDVEVDDFPTIILFEHGGVKYVKLRELKNRLEYVRGLIDRSMPTKAMVLADSHLRVRERLLLRALPEAVFTTAREKVQQIFTHALGELEDEPA